MQQPELVKYCQEAGILVCSYSPLVPLTKHKDGPVTALAGSLAVKYGCTPAQVLLRWNLQGGKGVITTSTRPEGTGEVLAGLFDFELSAEDVRAIDAAGASSPFRAYWTKCPMESEPRS